MTYKFDPELASLVESLPPMPSFHEDPVRARKVLRGMLAGSAPPRDDRVRLTDVQVGGVPVRVYQPATDSAEPVPLIVHMHGGAFITGDLDTADVQCASLSRKLPAVVVSVDYRLAPENPYPAALEDCYTVLTWAYEQAPDLGADPARLVVSGESAGAALAASLSLMARDQSGPPIAYQRLLIPVLDNRCQTQSAREMIAVPIFDAAANRGMWAAYLPPAEQSDPSPYAVPGRAADLSGLPPAFIQVAQFDPARDEAIEYAQRLLHAGVTVELHVVPGAFHGFAMATRSAVARRAFALTLAALTGRFTAPG
jgi:acetyl esterase/lipase